MYVVVDYFFYLKKERDFTLKFDDKIGSIQQILTPTNVGVGLMKYKQKYKILVLNTTCYPNARYTKSRDLYYRYLNDFKNKHVKLLANCKKEIIKFLPALVFDFFET